MRLDWDAMIDRADHQRKEAKENMNEEKFILREQDKLDAVLLADMERFEKYGFSRSKIKTEKYLINGMIELSSPRPGFPYNHYKITETGKEQVFAANARRAIVAATYPSLVA